MNINVETKKQTFEKPSNVKVSDKVKNYGNDPYFVKKANESKAFWKNMDSQKNYLVKDE